MVGKKKLFFAQKKFLSTIHTRQHLSKWRIYIISFAYNHKHILKNETSPDNFSVLHDVLPTECFTYRIQVFNSIISFLGLSHNFFKNGSL